MKKQAIGILAHVDAGKTTLSEALLFTAGKIKKLGRVDFRNTYLDTHELERERGITIFSKQALLDTGRVRITLLDTPGHVDFSAETERTLSVLDSAILVISGTEGVQTHTETLWSLLQRYRVPTFLFVTKMDLAGADRSSLLPSLVSAFGSGCVDFTGGKTDEWREQVAMTDEEALNDYLETGEVPDETVARLIADRKLFPCFFGSGLKLTGVEPLLRALETYPIDKTGPALPPTEDGPSFAARVYKIIHDKNGVRLTCLKVTGGTLSVRQTVTYRPLSPSGLSSDAFPDGETAAGQTGSRTGSPAIAPEKGLLCEKITAIRLYSGEKYESIDEASAGDVCAVAGLSGTYAGEGLGFERDNCRPLLEPVLSYRLTLPPDVNAQQFLAKLRLLEEEEPLLHPVWDERYGEISVQIMGEVQTEVLAGLIDRRFGVKVSFDEGRILYRETISAPVEGVGHFEPLRHYAEVHLLLEPGERGSGLVFDSVCGESVLEKNWQRLILTHLAEKQHRGVLTGSPITDMKITLTAGRSHLKHTQGGDFRESTYRAVRQGLMTARAMGKAVLLEPYYRFRLEVPGENVGRAISDILARFGAFEEEPAAENGLSVLSGRAPASTMGEYAKEVAAYTHGKGKFVCRVEGYFPCHNPEEAAAESAYDPERDMDNPTGSVFCAHGAGFPVPWHLVPEYMHLEGLDLASNDPAQSAAPPKVIERNLNLDEKELEAIMEREFGPIKRRAYGDPKTARTTDGKIPKWKKSLYLIDGYNVIFAWEELKEQAEESLEHARETLCRILSNYQAFTGREMVLLFDAYHVKGATERKFDVNGLHVVYTKEGELGASTSSAF